MSARRRVDTARDGAAGAAAALVLIAAENLRAQEPGGLVERPEAFDRFFHWVATVIEVGGIAIIVVGAVFATGLFLFDLGRTETRAEAYHRYRANLGRGILLGLELLVAADIVGTVAIDPTLANLAVLAGIVVIRTFLSFTLELEIEGRWPWQGRPVTRSKDEGAPGRPSRAGPAGGL